MAQWVSMGKAIGLSLHSVWRWFCFLSFQDMYSTSGLGWVEMNPQLRQAAAIEWKETGSQRVSFK